jgi:hypothetical protein
VGRNPVSKFNNYAGYPGFQSGAVSRSWGRMQSGMRWGMISLYSTKVFQSFPMSGLLVFIGENHDVKDIQGFLTRWAFRVD